MKKCEVVAVEDMLEIQEEAYEPKESCIFAEETQTETIPETQFTRMHQ